ncbi:MAG: type II toxin-antitoxin system prevent-host-death family antitoxin [Acidobacteria bacterium]|nr:type II toxin-antitoxin system prevent-host-death family antitoxin [Acidobacteriota bacterium]
MARPASPVSVVEAKARFSEIVRQAEAGAIVMIRRHGRDVAAVVPAKDAERVGRLRAAGPEKGLASVAGGWKGAEDLVSSLDSTGRSAPRRRPRLGR